MAHGPATARAGRQRSRGRNRPRHAPRTRADAGVVKWMVGGGHGRGAGCDGSHPSSEPAETRNAANVGGVVRCRREARWRGAIPAVSGARTCASSLVRCGSAAGAASRRIRDPQEPACRLRRCPRPLPPHRGTTSCCPAWRRCSALALLLHGPIAQWASYHAFADQRELWGIPHAADVLSNLPFAIAGLWASVDRLGPRHAAARGCPGASSRSP